MASAKSPKLLSWQKPLLEKKESNPSLPGKWQLECHCWIVQVSYLPLPQFNDSHLIANTPHIKYGCKCDKKYRKIKIQKNWGIVGLPSKALVLTTWTLLLDILNIMFIICHEYKCMVEQGHFFLQASLKLWVMISFKTKHFSISLQLETFVN